MLCKVWFRSLGTLCGWEGSRWGLVVDEGRLRITGVCIAVCQLAEKYEVGSLLGAFCFLHPLIALIQQFSGVCVACTSRMLTIVMIVIMSGIHFMSTQCLTLMFQLDLSLQTHVQFSCTAGFFLQYRNSLNCYRSAQIPTRLNCLFSPELKNIINKPIESLFF